MPSAETAATSAIAAIAHQACSNASCTARNPRGVPRIATKAATPSTSPIWRAMVTMADPVAVRCGGRSAVAAEMMVGKANPTPTPPTSQPGRKSATYDGCTPTFDATINVPTPNSVDPMAVRTPAGTRPDSRWATYVKIGTINGPGAMASPVCSADQCQTPCSQSTAASRPAPNVAENSTAVTLAHANARTRNNASSTTGRGCTAERIQKPTSDTAAMANDVSTPVESQPHSGPFTMPRATAPIPMATSNAPSRSGTRVMVRSRESGT